MAKVTARASMPLATNMCVVRFDDIEAAFRARAVGVVLSDHHFWGGLRDTQALSITCQAFDVGLSMHSNSHLGISLAAIVHVAAATPHLTYACDTHWRWSGASTSSRPARWTSAVARWPFPASRAAASSWTLTHSPEHTKTMSDVDRPNGTM
jgi:L-alanine-DL-glutamate epimerase-like enolase superfamily enzyme